MNDRKECQLHDIPFNVIRHHNQNQIRNVAAALSNWPDAVGDGIRAAYAAGGASSTYRRGRKFIPRLAARRGASFCVGHDVTR